MIILNYYRKHKHERNVTDDRLLESGDYRGTNQASHRIASAMLLETRRISHQPSSNEASAPKPLAIRMLGSESAANTKNKPVGTPIKTMNTPDSIDNPFLNFITIV